MKTHYLLKRLLLLWVFAFSASLWGQYTGTGTFTKINSLTDLTDGYYVVANSADGFAMNNTNAGKFFTKTDISPTSGTITNPSTSIVWKIESDAAGRTIYNEASSKYVSYTGSSNEAYAVATAATNNQKWTVAYSSSTFEFKNLAVPARILKYNAGAPRFACYTSGQQDLQLYKLVASTGPNVITTPATAIATTEATLNGSINANGVSTDASFDYGTTVGYGSTVTASPATATGSTITPITGALIALNVNAQYHYRVVGTVSGTVTNGTDMTFWTLANAPDAVTVSNPQLTALDVTLNTDGNPAITEYAIQETAGKYVQTNGSLGTSAVWQTSATWGVKTVTGLTASTTYTFKAKARNSANVETAFGGNATGTTLTPETVGYNVVQSPNTEQSATEGTNFTVYIRAYEDGVTNLAGENTRLKGWVGYSSTNDNPVNVGWTWIPATFNQQYGNDDEYQANIPTNVIGTFYYAARFELDNSGAYTYGGSGGNWNNDNVKLTVLADIVNYANIQSPATATINVGSTVTVYAQVYEPGITDAIGQGPGITAEIGYSTTNTTPDGTWTWLPTTFNVDSGNNDEYKADLGTGLTTGTYYYASRFIKDGRAQYVYGGTSGVWNNDSGVLTVNPDPNAYNGTGKFIKINSLVDLTDGYYVVTNEADAFLMTNVNSGYFVSAAVAPVSGVIENPSVNNVWSIKDNGAGKTIFNEAVSKYVGWVSGNSATAEDTPADSNRWSFTYSGSNFEVKNNVSSSRKLSYNASSPRFAAYTGSQQDLQLYKLVPSVTWDGSNWSNGTGPTSSMDAIIADDYNIGTAFEAKSITVNIGKTLSIDTSVKAGNIINEGSIIVADNANFIQTSAGTYSGAGTFKVNRNSESPTGKYAFWSSPVTSQDMYGIFETVPTAVMTYNTATDFYNTINPAISIAGTGYSIKTPTDAPIATFIGVPNNADVVVALSQVGQTYNLIGNPYPSNVDLNKFLITNSANIGSTLWFWDNTGGPVKTQTGSTATNFSFATFNAAGDSTWLQAPNGSRTPSGNYAKVGQGFIVEATASSVTFENEHRDTAPGVNMNKSTAKADGKLWLTLSTSYNSKVSQAITYQAAATNGFDRFDSQALGLGSDAFYSLVGAEKVVIQGRASFNEGDVVALGNKHFQAGNFTIALTQKEGVFAEGQAIYLRDNVAGTEVNLQEGAYSFTSEAGEFSNRFEVTYTKGTLATGNTVKNAVMVYRSGSDFVVDSPSKISTIELYDASGKLVQNIKSNSNRETISNLSRGVYILKIKTETETISKKIIK